MSKTIKLEEDVSFSNSIIWQQSQKYYLEKGIDAWTESVPFYITSNAFIGKQYADILLSAMQDWQSQQKDKVSCFSILEIGAGCGQLALYIINALNESLREQTHHHISFQYIISDLSPKNLAFIAKHPSFQSLLSSGQCRLACFDCVNDPNITLMSHHGHSEAILAVEGPLLSVANYLFDSLPADVYHVNEQLIQEARITLSSSRQNIAKDKPIDWKKVKLQFKQTKKYQRYKNKMHASILERYRGQLKDTYLLFPISSLKTLDTLKRIANNKLLLITSDKCFTDLTELAGQDAPELDVHGSFSVMVNLHAMTEYCSQLGGQSFVPSQRDGLSTALLSFGLDNKNCPRLQSSIKRHVEGFSASDYFNFYEHICDKPDSWPLQTLVSALLLSHWDPGLFSAISAALQEKTIASDSQVVDFLLGHLDNIAQQFYPISADDDAYYQLADLCYELDLFEQALGYFEQSDSAFPNDASTNFNIGLCHQALENHMAAALAFEKTLSIDPRFARCKSCLSESQAALTK